MSLKNNSVALLPSTIDRKEELSMAKAASSGDRASQRRIAQLILGKVRNIVGYAVSDQALAEDVTQSAMLKILCSLNDYRGESSIEFWSARIAVRMAMRAQKTARRRKYLLIFLPEPRSPFADTDEKAQASELRRQLNKLVGKLPLKQQEAVRLRYVHEYSIEEISELTCVSENTVRDRLQIGKKKLKHLLDRNPAIAAWILKRNP